MGEWLRLQEKEEEHALRVHYDLRTSQLGVKISGDEMDETGDALIICSSKRRQGVDGSDKTSREEGSWPSPKPELQPRRLQIWILETWTPITTMWQSNGY